jgi:hypothetical protein
MIRYKVQCPGIVGHECRTASERQAPANLIGTFLWRTQTAAEACAAGLRRLGFEPKLVRLLPAYLQAVPKS